MDSSMVEQRFPTPKAAGSNPAPSEIKKCLRCLKIKNLKRFKFKNKKKGKINTYCISCMNLYRREHHYKNKESHKTKRLKRRKEIDNFLFDYLNQQECIDCGEFDPVVLEFDHVIGKKKFSITEASQRGVSQKTLLEEIEKCKIRCANCHRRRTAKMFGWYNGRRCSTN